MLQVKNISQEVTLPQGESQVILKPVSFEVPLGTSLAIVGPSGSGKSTLLSLIAGLERPTQGEILLDEISISALNEEERAQARAKLLGLVFQSFHLFTHLTPHQNLLIALEIAHNARNKTKESPDANDQIHKALSDVGLGHRVHHLCRQLSGGEQQRVALARALVTQPKLLLCDEPTGNLDSKNASEAQELILQLHQKLGNTLVVVTHDNAFADSLQTQVNLGLAGKEPST